MPLYEYKCRDCESCFEFMQKASDPLQKKCPKCGGPLDKLPSAPALQFKGQGWYITDYAKKSGMGADKHKSPCEKKAEGKTESKTTSPVPKKDGSSSPKD